MENSWENQHRPWTWPENKAFEVALVEFDEETADRWRKVAGILPGRSPEEVEEHYNKLVGDVSAIEAGIVPLPDDVASGDVAEVVKRRVVVRKKGQSWTTEEHMLFLKGLKIYGKGDWRSISRKCVKTRTASQVASHAQKYFNRKNLKSNTRRTSIHDITLKSDDEDSLSGPVNIPNTNNEQISNELIGDIHQVPNQVGLVENNINGSLENNCELDFYHQGDLNVMNDTMMMCHPTSLQNQIYMGLNSSTDNQVINLQNGDVFMDSFCTNYPYVSFANGQVNYNGAGPSNLSPTQHYNTTSQSGPMRQVNGGHSNPRAIDLQYGDVFMGNSNVNYVSDCSVNLLNHQANANCIGPSNSSPPHHPGSTRQIIAPDMNNQLTSRANYLQNGSIYSPTAHCYNTNINQGSMRHIPNFQTIDLQNGTDSVHNPSSRQCVSMPNGQVNANDIDVSNSVPHQQPPSEQIHERIEN